MKSDERYISFFEVKIKAATQRTKGGKPISATKLYEILKYLYENDKTINKRFNETMRYYIQDIKRTADKAIILVNLSDIRTADAIYSDPDKKERQRNRKAPGQGGDFSSHVILDLNEGAAPVYQLLAEQVGGISGRAIANYFNRLLRDYQKAFPKDFQFPHPDGAKVNSKPKMCNSWPRIELAGLMSDSFKRDLLEGKLIDIELFTPEKKRDRWEETSFVDEVKQSVLLNPVKEKTLPSLAVLGSIFTSANEESLKYARVRFRAADGTPRTAQLDTSTQQLVDDFKYVKKKKISGFDNLASSHDEINASIVEQMIDLMG